MQFEYYFIILFLFLFYFYLFFLELKQIELFKHKSWMYKWNECTNMSVRNESVNSDAESLQTELTLKLWREIGSKFHSGP